MTANWLVTRLRGPLVRRRRRGPAVRRKINARPLTWPISTKIPSIGSVHRQRHRIYGRLYGLHSDLGFLHTDGFFLFIFSLGFLFVAVPSSSNRMNSQFFLLFSMLTIFSNNDFLLSERSCFAVFFSTKLRMNEQVWLMQSWGLNRNKIFHIIYWERLVFNLFKNKRSVKK